MFCRLCLRADDVKIIFSLSSLTAGEIPPIERKIYLFITCAYFPIDQRWGNVVAPSEAVVCCCLIWNGIEKYLKCVWNSHATKEKSIFPLRRKHKRENGKTKIESCKKSTLFLLFLCHHIFLFRCHFFALFPDPVRLDSRLHPWKNNTNEKRFEWTELRVDGKWNFH